ncbi:MAG: hypothetical protein MSA56_13110 [Clostridium sp.]|nr:hypothetical protein [Clostridium sp.]
MNKHTGCSMNGKLEKVKKTKRNCNCKKCLHFRRYKSYTACKCRGIINPRVKKCKWYLSKQDDPYLNY